MKEVIVIVIVILLLIGSVEWCDYRARKKIVREMRRLGKVWAKAMPDLTPKERERLRAIWDEAEKNARYGCESDGTAETAKEEE